MKEWHLKVNPSMCGCMVTASQAKHARLKLKLLQWGLTTIHHWNTPGDKYTYLSLQLTNTPISAYSSTTHTWWSKHH
jgi:hypothetical protein